MIVFDLICEDGQHLFEGWFGSSADFADQQAKGLVHCPVCDCATVMKAVMAPNVGKKGNQTSAGGPSKRSEAIADNPPEPATDAPVAASGGVPVSAEYQELIGKLAKAQEKLLAQSEWVGGKFADEARAIHYGDKEAKPIHGTASLDDAVELHEEGVEIAPLLVPVTPPEQQN